MSIRFACAQCGKIHRVPGHYAGRRGRCGKCGLRFVAPGMTPGSSNVFVPSDSDSDALASQLADQPTRDRSKARKALSLGLLIFILLIACILLAREGIVALAPSLAPMLGGVPNAPAGQPKAGLYFDHDAATRIGVALSMSAHLLILVAMPLTLPAVLSRCRMLSVGRWLIMSAVCGFFALTAFSSMFAITLGSAVGQGLAIRSLGMVLATIACYLFASLFFGIPGCLIAAAVHPRDLPRP